MRWKSHVRFGGRAGETTHRKMGRALRSDPYTEHPTREVGFPPDRGGSGYAARAVTVATAS
jgi:hypothetical protein